MQHLFIIHNLFPLLRLICCVSVLAVLSGCSTMGYYWQTASGHLELLRKKEPIDELLQSGELDEKTASRLKRSQLMRKFASTELGLPDNDSYKEYADLGRNYVTWGVTAAPEFSLKPYKSCYLFVGCMSYRGYHDKQKAYAFADELAEEGYDVSVRGVSAYSTLGWFDDPLLNTMMHWSDTQLARLIFHELSHQVMYIKNDTPFNEAFSVSVEREGVKRWLRTHATTEEQAAYRAHLTRHERFVEYVLAFRSELEALYETELPEPDMRQAKLQAYKEFKDGFQQIKATWNGFAGYDSWFDDVNNAKVALFSTYREKVAGFDRLLASVDYDLPAFYERVKQISRLNASERDLCLEDLIHCPE